MRMLLIALLTLPVRSLGQDVELEAQGDASLIMVRGMQGDGEARAPVLQAVWRMADDAPPAFAFQRTAEPASGSHARLDAVVVEALGQYLDQHIHFAHDGVQADRPVQHLVDDMNAMVHVAAEEFQCADLFPGLGQPTTEQLQRLVRISWGDASRSLELGGEQDKYLAIYHFVRSQRDELERQVRADVIDLDRVDLLAPEEADPGRTVQVPSVCGTVFDDENFLCALDLTVGDTGAMPADPRLGQAAIKALDMASEHASERSTTEMPEHRVRKRDRWLKTELDAINERIDRMDQRKELWQLRDRMDDVEARMDDIQMQVTDLQDAGREADKGGDNPIANLSRLTGRNVAIQFRRNSTQVDPEYRPLLNEVFDQLAHEPGERVLITGYADRSGDADLNMRLSEERSKAVRAYLMERGIDGSRLLLNYFGASRSAGRDPNERRVEIEWLQR
ncbi:MAG: OmpA family protein [Flavobacteriales bacterium]|nr:OmpA family protein [Flavobacteriales bacterium]